MASFNKITIVGYLGRDPELKFLPSGNAVCNFSVAATEKRNSRDGEAQETTTWFKITVWGKQAENCNEYLSKGSQAYIEGRLSLQEYTDREGQKRSTLEVNASDVRFLGKKGESDGADRQTRPVTKQEVAKAVQELEDDEIPF